MTEAAAAAITDFEKRFRTALLVVMAQIFISLVLLAAAFFISGISDASATAQGIFALWAAIFIVAVSTLLLRRVLFSPRKLRKTFLEKGSDGLLLDLQMKTILLGSLAEIIAVVGFLIATLGDKWDMFRAGVVALVVFWAIFPRRARWQETLANLDDSRGI